ncbi:MAG: hypothetical protein NVS2B16_22150 [Chloroflexota bacterium]
MYLANGYFSASIDHTGGALYDSDLAPCYVRGLYTDRGHGGIDRLACIPCWTRFRYGHPAQVEHYRQDLDLRRGLLRTAMTLREQRGTVAVEHETFISRADPHQAGIRMTVCPDFDGEIELLAALEQTPDADVEITEMDAREDGLFVGGLVPVHGVRTAQALRFEAPHAQIRYARSSTQVSACLSFRGTAGDSFTAAQLIRVATSLENDDPRALSQFRNGDYGELKARHEAAWERLWQTDIEIAGDPGAQQFLRAALFYLWSTVRDNDEWSIAPMGLSSNGYNGHIFWDAELWMYPSLLVTQPTLAKACVAYRERTITAARDRARLNNYRGAQFPWEGAFTGEEMTPTWAETRDFQIHVTADVAIAQWWYYLNTGDRDWLRVHGYPIIKECAEFWVSRVEHNASTDRYEVSDVVCADEYAAHVDNDAFTNASVRVALLIAERAARLCDQPVDPSWHEVAMKMYIPFDPDQQVHVEYDGYDGGLTKQADVELLTYTLEYVANPRQIARDLDYYDRAIDPDGPAMSFSVYSIISAQLGRGEAAYRYFQRSYVPNTRPPFHVFSETPTNDEYFFCTGIGGSLQAILFGFSGLRLREGGFLLNPLLPPGWRSLYLKNIFLAGGRASLYLEPGFIRLERGAADGVGGPALELRRTEDGLSIHLDEGGSRSIVRALRSDGDLETEIDLRGEAELLQAVRQGLRLVVQGETRLPALDVVVRQEEQPGRPLH